MFSHLDENKKNPQMVNVSQKEISLRTALACGSMFLGKKIREELEKTSDFSSPKGPVFATAIIAGTMAVKKCHELIPFCHPLLLEDIKIVITPKEAEKIEITCFVQTQGKTGVEMEALTGVHIAALTIYDMCKAISTEMVVEQIFLKQKTGGKKDLLK